MRTLKYSAGAVLSSVALVAGFTVPAAAIPGSPGPSTGAHNTKTTIKNINSNNTTNLTSTTTTTTTTNNTATNTYTNTGIVQTQTPHYYWYNPDKPSSSSQTAVQGTNSGVYKVAISQKQSTTQNNETSNSTYGQANFSLNTNQATSSEDQTNTQTNSNTQNVSQSNTTTQNLSTNQSAQGVVIN